MGLNKVLLYVQIGKTDDVLQDLLFVMAIGSFKTRALTFNSSFVRKQVSLLE